MYVIENNIPTIRTVDVISTSWHYWWDWKENNYDKIITIIKFKLIKILNVENKTIIYFI